MRGAGGAGVLAAPGTQGSWRLDSRKYSASERYGNQYWPTHSSILAWRTPSLTEKPGRPQSNRVAKTLPKQPCRHSCKTPFACGSSAPVRAERELAQLLGLWGLRRCQACRDTDCLHCRRYGPIGVFLPASASWRSEGLFGRSFSVTPPIQELRGLPSLRSFSVVCRVRHIEGPPWVGSTLKSVRPALMGQPLYCSAANAVLWEDRGYGDGSTPTRDSAVFPCFLGASFPSQAFPTTVSSLRSPPSVPPQSTAALALGLLHNP